MCLAPLYWLAITSLKGPAALVYGPFYLPGLDFVPSLAAWRDVLSTGEVANRFTNTVVVALASSALTMTACVLALHDGRGARVTTALLVTRLIPPVVTVAPVYLLASAAGLLDTRTVLVGTYSALNLPVALWLMRPSFGRHLQELEEAATLDGASRLRILRDVTLPLVSRPLAAVGLLVLVLCWNEYLYAAYLSAADAQTLPPFLVGQMSVREQQAGSDPDEVSRLAAVAVLMVAPLIAVAWWITRAFDARER